uniref:Uncharacterized protein n=1 Tax=Aegilops tauschii subsp. strangulata TaxID=200361 RepID=A0A452ZC57_AEGTS
MRACRGSHVMHAHNTGAERPSLVQGPGGIDGLFQIIQANSQIYFFDNLSCPLGYAYAYAYSRRNTHASDTTTQLRTPDSFRSSTAPTPIDPSSPRLVALRS